MWGKRKSRQPPDSTAGSTVQGPVRVCRSGGGGGGGVSGVGCVFLTPLGLTDTDKNNLSFVCDTNDRYPRFSNCAILCWQLVKFTPFVKSFPPMIACLLSSSQYYSSTRWPRAGAPGSLWMPLATMDVRPMSR